MLKAPEDHRDFSAYESHLFGGPKTFSRARWKYWKQRFLVVRDESKYSKEVEAAASLAGQSMDEAERMVEIAGEIRNASESGSMGVEAQRDV